MSLTGCSVSSMDDEIWCGDDADADDVTTYLLMRISDDALTIARLQAALAAEQEYSKALKDSLADRAQREAQIERDIRERLEDEFDRMSVRVENENAGLKVELGMVRERWKATEKDLKKAEAALAEARRDVTEYK